MHPDVAQLGAVGQQWVAQMANIKYTIKYCHVLKIERLMLSPRYLSSKGKWLQCMRTRLWLKEMECGRNARPGIQTFPGCNNGRSSNCDGLKYMVPHHLTVM